MTATTSCYQENSRGSGRRAATATGGLVRARPAIIIGAWPMFLRLLPNTASWLSMRSGTTTWIAAANIFTTRNSIAWRKLNFQFNNFVPLFVRAVALRNRKKVTQATTAVILRRSGNDDRGIFRRIFRDWIIHCLLTKAGLMQREPRMDQFRIISFWQQLFWEQQQP